MITPSNYDMNAYQGATFDVTITWSLDDTPVNLTGYTAAMQIREHVATPVVLSLQSGYGITLGGDSGTITITIDATTMTGISSGRYVYDLELYTGSEVTRLLQGQFLVSSEVTK